MRSQEKEQQSYYKMRFRSGWTGNYLAFVHDVRNKMRSALMSWPSEKHVHSSSLFLTETILYCVKRTIMRNEFWKAKGFWKMFLWDKTKSFVAIYLHYNNVAFRISKKTEILLGSQPKCFQRKSAGGIKLSFKKSIVLHSSSFNTSKVQFKVNSILTSEGRLRYSLRQVHSIVPIVHALSGAANCVLF